MPAAADDGWERLRASGSLKRLLSLHGHAPLPPSAWSRWSQRHRTEKMREPGPRLTASSLRQPARARRFPKTRPRPAPKEHAGEYVWVDQYAGVKPVEVYALGPGDLVAVRVLGHDDLSTKAKVRADGRISIPYLDDVEVAGHAPAQIAEKLRREFIQIVAHPVVTVTVDEPHPFTIPVTGEGIGLGVPIVHYPDGWVYARTFSDVDLSTTGATVWKRTFHLDEIGGDAAHRYQFVPIPSRGDIAVTYTIDGRVVSISVAPVWIAPGYSEVGILNEQSAAFNDLAADQQSTLTGAAFGSWVPVTGRWARVRSSSLGVEWSVSTLPGAALYGGREQAPPDFNWAGLDYIFPGSFGGTDYQVTVQEAR